MAAGDTSPRSPRGNEMLKIEDVGHGLVQVARPFAAARTARRGALLRTCMGLRPAALPSLSCTGKWGASLLGFSWQWPPIPLGRGLLGPPGCLSCASVLAGLGRCWVTGSRRPNSRHARRLACLGGLACAIVGGVRAVVVVVACTWVCVAFECGYLGVCDVLIASEGALRRCGRRASFLNDCAQLCMPVPGTMRWRVVGWTPVHDHPSVVYPARGQGRCLSPRAKGRGLGHRAVQPMLLWPPGRTFPRAGKPRRALSRQGGRGAGYCTQYIVRPPAPWDAHRV